jgi:hypothetical protein
MSVAFGREDRIGGNLSEGGGPMKPVRIGAICLLCVAFSWALVLVVTAGQAKTVKVQPYEGQIRSIKVDKCGLQPGSCEGSVILARAANAGDVTLAIKPGTWLKRGDQLVTIDELGVGNYVKVEAMQIPGVELQQITILSRED